MALADRGSAVDRRHHAVARELRWIGAEPHRAAEIAPRLALLEARFGHPFGDKADHGFVGRAKFGRRRLLDSRQVPYALDARHLHAEADAEIRSEEHTSELQSLMRISYAVFCLKKTTQVQTYSNR